MSLLEEFICELNCGIQNCQNLYFFKKMIKKPILLVAAFVSILLLVAGCRIFNSGDKVNITIEHDSQLLTDQGSIKAQIVDPTSEKILIYGETLHSNLERLHDSGNWVRLVTQLTIPCEVHIANISYQSIVNLIDATYGNAGGISQPFTAEGEHRFVFELVFNNESKLEKLTNDP